MSLAGAGRTPLTRDEFRAGVIARDGGRCVHCGRAGSLDAHHILERRLFDAEDPVPGGYALDNGASLCAAPPPGGGPSCHQLAEQTVISPRQLRATAGIRMPLLPACLESGRDYTKWGDEELPDGRRLRGPLFTDESVQKALAHGQALGRYAPSFKYPRTPHLPFSPGASADDRMLASCSQFEGRDVVVTEKLDGESATMTRELFHARSLDSGYHPGRTWAKNLWGAVRFEIPEGWRLCGENLQARHTVPYEGLPGHFVLFSVWNERNEALSWQDTCEWAQLLGVPHAPVIAAGPWDEQHARRLAEDGFPSAFGGAPAEGFTVRLAGAFAYRDFGRSLAKSVRAGFVPGHEGHWQSRQLQENGLA